MLALIVSIGAGYFFVAQGEDYTAADLTRRDPSPQPSTNAESSAATPSTPPTEKFSPPPEQHGTLNAADLSLGIFTIDDPEEKVRRALGEPLSTKFKEGRAHLMYDNIEVVTRNGKICALVSQTAAVATPRGIHDGSPAQEVFDRYGTDYQSSRYEDTTLYEYTITSRDGTPCWLRFAVRDDNGNVDYISIRFVQ